MSQTEFYCHPTRVMAGLLSELPESVVVIGRLTDGTTYVGGSHSADKCGQLIRDAEAEWNLCPDEGWNGTREGWADVGDGGGGC